MRIRITLPSFILPLCLLGLLLGVNVIHPGANSQGQGAATAAQIAAAIDAQNQAAALLTRDESAQQRFRELSAKLQRSKAKVVRVIVQLRVAWRPEGAMQQAAERLAQRVVIRQAQDELLNSVHLHNPRSVKRFDYLPNLGFSVNAAELEALRLAPQVMNIQEDRFLKVAQALPPSLTVIGAPNAWAAGYTGDGKSIAILDTGVDKTHPSLSQKVISEACYSTDDSDFHLSSLCPGGATELITPDSGVNCTAETATGIFPDCAHGTSVAGVALGVAKNAKLISIQVGSLVTFDDDPEGPCGGQAPCIRILETDLKKGLERVNTLKTVNNIDIAAANVGLSIDNNKFSSQCDGVSFVKSAIDLLQFAKIATVVASGNSPNSSPYVDGITLPSCISSAISVGATGDDASLPAGNVAPYSNSAPILKLLAPGYFPSAPVPGGGGNNVSGTSFAAAHVSGAIAIIKQQYPSAEVSEVLNRLKNSRAQITDPRNGAQMPRIHLEDALSCLQNVPDDRWKGEYFNNTNLAGDPVMRRDDGGGFLSKNFGAGSPSSICGPGPDNFSVRWTQRSPFTANVYRFTVTADDGFRLYVDDVKIMDFWNGPPGTNAINVLINEGNRKITLEYREFGGTASADLSWVTTCVADVPVTAWKGEYYNNSTLAPPLLMVRNDGTGFLNFDWGLGGPDSACLLGVDNFSARWTRKVNFVETGKYRFTVIGDDGVRLWVGGLLKIDEWRIQAPTTYEADVDLIASNHDLKLEYFEGGGTGVTHLSWAQLPNPPLNLGTTAILPTQIDLSWTDNNNSEGGFKIERGNGSSFAEIGTVGPNVTTFIDTGLTPATTYQYRVRAFNSVDNSSYSNQISVTTLPCIYSVSPGFITAGVNGEIVSVSVTTGPGCQWTAVSNKPWISVSPGSGAGSRTVSVFVSENFSGVRRVGTVTIAGEAIGVSQNWR